MKQKNGFKLLTITIALAAIGMSARAQQVQSLSPVLVSGQTQTSILNPGMQQEQAKLDKVAGGTNLINPQQEQSLVTLKNALDYQPGLIVQEFFGGLDQPRLNIRGSGIQSNPVNRGVLLLQDGLPLNEADGSFLIGFLEPRNAHLISVRRGANALSPAATTLGGELDFQSLVGTNGDVLRVEGGSFGRLGLQAAKGFEDGNLDGRISVTHDKYDGYRHHSGSKRTSIQSNFGVQGDSFENRTYLSYVDIDVTIPTVVPRKHMMHDPRWVTGDGNTPFDKNNIYDRNPYRKSSQFRLANRTFWGDESLNNTLGVYIQNIDDVFQDPKSNTTTKGMTYGAQWQLAGKYQALDYKFGLDWSYSDMDRNIYENDLGSKGQRQGQFDLSAENQNALLGLAWHINDQFTLVGDAKFTHARRNAKEKQAGNRLNQSWDYVTPKLGLIWQPLPEQRFFANISRNNEAPTFWEIIHGNTDIAKLKIQKANTFEIGGQGVIGVGEYAPNWALTYYYSDIKDELMSVSNINGTPAGTYNYRGGTKHQGIEFGLDGSLPGFVDGTGFDYRMAYTYSDFRFKGGEFSGNRIAGVPVHMISAELLYKVGGLRFGPNLRWMPSDTETFHNNASGTQQDSYALLGFSLDYQFNKNFNVYLRGDNLTNRTYASAFVIRDNQASPPGMSIKDVPTFLPGNGRSVMAGLSYKF